MLSGECYDTRDPELLEMYHRARALILAYNSCDSRNLERRNELLEDLLGKKPRGCGLNPPSAAIMV